MVELGKRIRRMRAICSCCISPRTSNSSSRTTSHAIFNQYEEDIWIEIAKHMDGKSLLKLSMSNRWFRKLLTEECVWKYACFRDLQVPCIYRQVEFKWSKIYASAFDGTHSFMFHQKEKHIDWMRLGSFMFDSSNAFLTQSLSTRQIIPNVETVQRMLELSGCCVLKDIKPGIWLADLQLVGCPVCDLKACDGTMQILDVRHIELFLNKEYHEGAWQYELLGTYDTKKPASAASGAIFDIKHLRDKSNAGIFVTKSWVAKPKDWQPKAVIANFSVAICTNLQPNEGLRVKYQAMRAGENGQVVSIRISQQLL